jgi:hypothetical protein
MDSREFGPARPALLGARTKLDDVPADDLIFPESGTISSPGFGPARISLGIRTELDEAPVDDL